MTPRPLTSTLRHGEQPFQSLDDAFLTQFDDAALERALRTVHWHPKDVSQFLRTSGGRRPAGTSPDILLAPCIAGPFSPLDRDAATGLVP